MLRLPRLAVAAVALLVPVLGTASPSAAAPATDRVVVTLRADASPTATARHYRGLGAQVRTTYAHVARGFAASVTPAVARRLASDPRVARVERDMIVRVGATQTAATWGLDRVDQRALPLSGTYSYDTDGSGVTAYVVDTGVRSDHAELVGRVRPGFDAIAGSTTEDCHGHGTHVAGTVAGVTAGVAKAAAVVPVRVLGCDGSGYVSNLVKGLEWVVAAHAAGVPAVANLSIGAGASETLDAAVRAVVADGVTVVAAAGNAGTDACTQSPARVPEALTVGATGSTDTRATFSNHGPCLDLFAPGVSITSAGISSSTALVRMSGTSMAAPHVAGIAALHLSAHPAATPAAVAAAIADAATAGVVVDAGVGSPNRLAFAPTGPTAAPAPAPAPSATAPAAPSSVTATAARKAATVRWVAGADGGSPITSFTVRASTTAGKVVKTVTVAGTATSATITGLRSGSSYAFSVAATNAVGTSPWATTGGTIRILAR